MFCIKSWKNKHDRNKFVTKFYTAILLLLILVMIDILSKLFPSIKIHLNIKLDKTIELILKTI